MTQFKLSRPQGSIVTIYNNNNSILLRFNYKRINYSLGLPVTPNNLKIAERKAILITNEIAFNTFDLSKYKKEEKPNNQNKEEKKLDSLGGILDFYINCKGHLDSSTIESITILRKWINHNPKFNLPENLQDFLFYLRKQIHLHYFIYTYITYINKRG